MDFGFICNIISIFLFGVYVIGTAWNIINRLKIDNEFCEMLGLDGNGSITGEVLPNFICQLDGDEVIKFNSDMYIQKFKVFEIEYGNPDFSNWKKVNRHPIYTCNGLNTNRSIYIKLRLPEGEPSKCLIEYTTSDYIKISFIQNSYLSKC